MPTIGIIGGSGLEQLSAFQINEEKKVVTPYGVEPVILKIGILGENKLVFLSRHGQEHTIPPSQVNFRANIFALKEVGCDYILATTAAGSLKEDIKRGDLVILDQFIDFTKHRFSTFYEKFEPHKPIHTALAYPFSEFLRKKIIIACQKLNLSFHEKGTVVTIEGPRFSTIAESKMFKMWGADVINMSIAPEAILCNEAGLPYAAIAMSTDYDCWKEDEVPVSWEKVLEVFGENVKKVTSVLLETIESLNKEN
ncbi:MAG: Purine nucleoside phosphorylase [Candidatus Magasanikbacteria bacterium GW2011_GWC2_40_17]|uniref:Purine nucleoside phosphorylase n=1 Tax=Candidatus Magasanikbacteria bacterium GW2011_GWA2_42_32 TaxID=1619039 RepID=A0A0G1A8Q0_9BACT|nr:MAG: Purine nucleoside phosphorylase [Candidatus Magasanikbacteria bacterium GW2011_GWC2_40_17]KKS57410.1 MAG: Purine nucleoside phosphorylase [Candidatus Magasanikbacteria bacterium GW2011_GWA2_42_32]